MSPKKPKSWHHSHHVEQYLVARLQFLTSLHQIDFVQVVSDKPFNYHSGLWMLLSHIIVSQNMLQILKMTMALWRMPSQLRIFLLNFELDGITSHARKQGLAATYSFKMAAFEVKFRACFGTNFFRIAGTSEVETSMSGKAACLLAGILWKNTFTMSI